MAKKPYAHFGSVGRPAEKTLRKKKRPKLIAVIDQDMCTGCQVCTLFCPGQCITAVPREDHGLPIPPVQVDFHQCIGCQLCVKACSKLTWDAIQILDVDDFEAQYGITITADGNPPQTVSEPVT